MGLETGPLDGLWVRSGEAIGLNVGILVGWKVGEFVGTADGVSVWFFDGLLDGPLVGDCGVESDPPAAPKRLNREAAGKIDAAADAIDVKLFEMSDRYELSLNSPIPLTALEIIVSTL